MKARTWIPVLGVALLMGCGSGGSPRTYVLSEPAGAVAGVSAADTRPVVELTRVTVPDYLDTTDMSRRDGSNGIVASRTGRWGERLSAGIARALAGALARRMPSIQVARTRVSARTGRVLSVDIEAFDVLADGRCVLTASWTVMADDRQAVTSAARATIVTRVADGAAETVDSRIAAAMAEAVARLAEPVAATLSRLAR